MPVYDFLCQECGVFPVMSSIANRDISRTCPMCQGPIARVISAPSLALMSTDRRTAYTTNERAEYAPSLSSDIQARSHRLGCACCSNGKVSLAGGRSADKKGTSNGRPWMLSH
jgi:putative FmdB family regulatory protein